MAELTWVVGYIPRWFTCPKTVAIQILTGPGVRQLLWLDTLC